MHTILLQTILWLLCHYSASSLLATYTSRSPMSFKRSPVLTGPSSTPRNVLVPVLYISLPISSNSCLTSDEILPETLAAFTPIASSVELASAGPTERIFSKCSASLLTPTGLSEDCLPPEAPCAFASFAAGAPTHGLLEALGLRLDRCRLARLSPTRLRYFTVSARSLRRAFSIT